MSWSDDFEARIIAIALENRSRFHGSSKRQTRLLRSLIAGADVAFGVYPSQEGLSLHLIKGEEVLTARMCQGSQRNYTIEAVLCREVEEVMAMRKVFGDLAHRH
jgi:hypothetical protein